MITLSIIIPNYNGEDLLTENLPHVFTAMQRYCLSEKVACEIIVVDDASTDNSQEVVRKIIHEQEGKKSEIICSLLENEENLGFGKTVNKGVSAAKGKLLVLLNTDVRPEKDFLKPLLQHFSDESVFAVGCMDRSVESGKTILRGRGIGHWQRGFLMHARGEIDSQKTLWVNGGSGAFRKALWEKLQGLDELYSPFYWEDIDLSYRALKSGYRIIFEKKSVVTHEHEKGAIKKYNNAKEVKKISYRNQLIFVWKNITDGKLFLSHLCWLPYHMGKAVFSIDLEFLSGFFMATSLLPRILVKRVMQKKYFVKSDVEVLKEYGG